MTSLRLMLRRHRWMIGAWTVLLITLSGATVSAYQSTYPTAQQRLLAVRLAQDDPSGLLVYGSLPTPGTPPLMFTWEIGAFATVLVSIMAVLLVISLTRAAEDDGTAELMRTAGMGSRVPLQTAVAVVALVALVLTLGSTAALGLAAGHVDGVTWSGSLAFGGVIGLTALLVAALTLLLAQIAPSTTDARLLGFTTLAAAFAIRALADTQHLDRLNWLSPLALRATVRPFAAIVGGCCFSTFRWWCC